MQEYFSFFCLLQARFAVPVGFSGEMWPQLMLLKNPSFSKFTATREFFRATLNQESALPNRKEVSRTDPAELQSYTMVTKSYRN